MAETRFSIEDKFNECSREVLMRTRVYPRVVAKGQMKQENADRQIAIMRAIADDYQRMLHGERLL